MSAIVNISLGMACALLMAGCVSENKEQQRIESSQTGESPSNEAERPMEISSFMLCDLDHDTDCDEEDEAAFNESFGKCRGDPDFNFYADIDGDGCVATNDKATFARIAKAHKAPQNE